MTELSEAESRALAHSFRFRCWRFAPASEPPLPTATLRLAYACQDSSDIPWPLNRREVRELKALVENLLVAVGAIAAPGLEAGEFVARCAPLLPASPESATSLLAAAYYDDSRHHQPFNPRQVRELKGLIEALLDRAGA